jgi:hypothetical protein
MHAIYVILVLAVSALGLIACDTRRHRAEVLDAAHAQRSAVCVRRADCERPIPWKAHR